MSECATKVAGLSRRNFLELAGVAAGALAVSGMVAGAGEASAAQADDTQVVTDMGGTEVTVPAQVKKYADGWYAHN